MPVDQFKEFNCYVILDIQPTSSPQEIKAAWRKVSLKSHPDVGDSNAAQAKVNLAYEVLSDPIQRRAHDVFWKTRTAQSGFGSQTSNRSRERQANSNQGAPSSSQGLTAFSERVEAAIRARKSAVWANLNVVLLAKFENLRRRRQAERQSFFFCLGGAILTGLFANKLPILWVATALLTLVSISKVEGITIEGKRIPLFGDHANELIRQHANYLASQQCHSEANSFDRYLADYASIIDLAMRPSSFDDSETHVVRRLVVALFLSGYSPSQYDGESRTILFTDGDEKLAVRFRHRSGAAINITYIRGLYDVMSSHGGCRGLLFCSPGLSGNAAIFAQARGVKWYSLESMNRWIDEVLSSSSSGPRGNVLSNLDILRNFISRITPKVSSYRRRRRGYR